MLTCLVIQPLYQSALKPTNSGANGGINLSDPSFSSLIAQGPAPINLSGTAPVNQLTANNQASLAQVGGNTAPAGQNIINDGLATFD